MKSLSNFVSGLIDRIQFKNIRLISIIAFAASIFFTLLQSIIYVGRGYRLGASSVSLGLISLVLFVLFLIFVALNSKISNHFVLSIICGAYLIIGFIVTIYNLFSYISWYARMQTYSSYGISDTSSYFAKNIVLYILDFGCYITLIAAVVFLIIAIKKKQSSDSRVSFAIPICIFIINLIINGLYFLILIIFGYSSMLISTIANIIFCATMVVYSAYLESRDVVIENKTNFVPNPQGANNSFQNNIDYNFMNMGIGVHFILTIITCGIWNYIGIFKITRYLSSLDNNYYRDPVTKLLLCMFVPF